MELNKYELREGDQILCYTPIWVFPVGILSWLIRLFLGIPYNHLKCVGKHNGQLMITESDHNGTHPQPLFDNLAESKSTKFLVLRPKFEIPNKYSKHLQETWGIKYGWFALVKYAYAIITKQAFRSKATRTKKNMVCSHPAAYAFGFSEWWKWTPKTWYKSNQFTQYKLIK